MSRVTGQLECVESWGASPKGLCVTEGAHRALCLRPAQRGLTVNDNKEGNRGSAREGRGTRVFCSIPAPHSHGFQLGPSPAQPSSVSSAGAQTPSLSRLSQPPERGREVVRNGQPHSFPVTTCSLGGLGCVWSGAKAGAGICPTGRAGRGCGEAKFIPGPSIPPFSQMGH